jgi:hypothetical protein
MLTGPPGQDRAHPRGGLLLPPRPPPGADAQQDRRHEGRPHHRRSPPDPASTAAPTAATAWRARSTRARCRRSPTRSRTTASAARASSPTSRRVAPSAATAPCSRASPGGAARQDRRALGLDPAEMRLARCWSRRSLTANFLRIGTIGLGACIEKVVEGSGWRERRGKLGRAAAASASRAPATCAAPACRSTGTSCRTPACSCELDRSRRSDRVLRQRPRSARAATTCSRWIVAEVLGIDPFDIKVVTGDTDLTPVDLGSYSSRVTADDGQRGDPGRRARARPDREERRREARRPAGAGSCSPSARVRRRGPEEVGMTFQDAVILAPRRASARSAPSAATRRRRRREVQAAAASGRARPTRTAAPSSRSRSTRRPAGSGSRRSGSRTTSAVR